MSWISTFDTADRLAANYQVFPADPALSPWVSYYWVIKCGRDAPIAPEFLAPDGLEEIIFSFDSDFVRQSVTDVQNTSISNRNSYVVGCKPYGLVCTRTTSLSMVGVKLMPGTLVKLLKLSMAEVGGKTLPFDALSSLFLNDLEAQVFDTRSLLHIKHRLDHALARQLSAVAAPGVVDLGIRCIIDSKGHSSVTQLAERTGLGTRQLQKRFGECIGLSPKAVASIIRFKHLFHTLKRASNKIPPALEDFGYYDQSHLLKDFRRYTGTTPQRLFGQKGNLSTEVFDLCLRQDMGEHIAI